MFIDKNGFECFIYLDGRLHHAIGTEDVFLSYENIIKNLSRTDPWGGFNIKQYNVFGGQVGTYKYIVNFDILLNTPKFTKLANVFHPQFLI